MKPFPALVGPRPRRAGRFGELIPAPTHSPTIVASGKQTQGMLMPAETTELLSLPYIMPGQAQKHVTHNEAIRALDALVQLAVKSRDLAEPPAEPAPGERHIVAADATAAWAGKDGRVAAWVDGSWHFLAPNTGWLAWVEEEETLLVFSSAGWIDFAPAAAGGNTLGVNTDADDTNRLAVKSDAVLLSHDDVTPGTGNLRVIVNKAGGENTAALLFQSGYSGRGEIGLTGNDDLTFKVSADGSAWRQSIVVDRETGKVSFPSGSAYREPLAGNRTYYVRTDGNDANDGLGDDAGSAFATIQKAIDTAYDTLDFAGYDVTIQLNGGTHTAPVAIAGKMQVGAGLVTIRGNPSAPGDVTLNTSSAAFANQSPVEIEIEGLKIQTSSGNCLEVERGASVILGAIEFGAAGTDHTLVRGGRLQFTSNYTISGSARYHLQVNNQGLIQTPNAVTVTLTGTPAFTRYCNVVTLGYAAVNNFSFSGGATGQRYRVTLNAIINTLGGGADFFPGSAAGVAETGGQYV